MNRRDTVVALAALGAAPLLRAQAPALPVVGYLSNTSASSSTHLIAALRRGLGEAGYEEGKTVAIDFRYADGKAEQIPGFVADFVSRKVGVIVATGGATTWMPAKAATATIPLVFTGGGDPVKLGLVVSLGRPGGNATGLTTNSDVLSAKRLQLLRELVPTAASISFLLNSQGDPYAAAWVKDTVAAAKASGHEFHVVNVRGEADFESAFAEIRKKRSGALLVDSSPFLVGRRAQIVALAAKNAIPASYAFPEFVDAGGLMSYGVNLSEIYRQAGVYAGRILKGAKPADLPVLQPTVFELTLNLKTAKALGIKIPQSVLIRADRVVE